MPREYNKVSDQIRDLIIDGYEKGYMLVDLHRLYNVKLATVKKLIERYKKYGNQPLAKGHRRKSLNDQHRAKINEWIDENCQLTLDDISERLKENFDVQVSKSTIFRSLKALHFSVKRISPIPIARNNAQTIQRRCEYAAEFLELDRLQRDKIFFIDEAGICIHARSNYGRAKVGERANLRVRSIRGKNMSVCAAMCRNSLFFYECQNRPYDNPGFEDFVRQLLNHLQDNEICNAILIMDNVPFHHCSNIEALVTEKQHRLLFLPPYSPFLNPIENLFNQLKFYVKRLNPSNQDEVFSSVEQASQVISKEDCSNYYANMLKYVHMSIQRIEIEN